jgi:UPF0755 protein
VGKLFGFLISVLVIAGALAAGAIFYGNYLYAKEGPVTADGQPRIVTIAKGAPAISTKLKDAGAIEDALQFRLLMRGREFMPGADKVVFKAGEYAIPSKASIADIVKQISEGKSLEYVVIIPEGLTSAMIMQLLADKEWKSAPGAGSETAIKLTGKPPTTPAEGVILPGGYHVVRGATIESVVQRAIKAQNDLMAQLWPNRQAGLPSEIKTPQDAIKLASIVENESGHPEDRPMVASSFLNRLRKPMRLDSDVTIVYGLSRGVPLGHEIRASEKAQKTEWNTYLIDGLPKTPICNPGEAAIRAVLNPPQSNYIYFVAEGGSGKTLFAATLAEHNANVANYREFEKQRNAERERVRKAAGQ